LRWRTALVLRELEAEITEIERFEPDQLKLDALMARKELLEHSFSQLRLELQRLSQASTDPPPAGANLKKRLQAIRAELLTLDEEIAPIAQAASSLLNARWGLLLRCGNDKSHLARQIERYADVYTSRVSNLLAYTPFAYLRAHRGNLPHDPGAPGI
jgi:chromosome segregation ATPase